MKSPTGTPEGTTFPPDLERLGIIPGAKIDIRDLDTMGKRHNFHIYLYFEEDLARDSTLKEDLQEYGDVPDLERPFIRLDAFLRFATESDPLFTRRLNELPLVVEVVPTGRSGYGRGNPRRTSKGSCRSSMSSRWRICRTHPDPPALLTPAQLSVRGFRAIP